MVEPFVDFPGRVALLAVVVGVVSEGPHRVGKIRQAVARATAQS